MNQDLRFNGLSGRGGGRDVGGGDNHSSESIHTWTIDTL